MNLQIFKNLRATWKNKELRKYVVLKEIVTLMGLFEFLGLGGGLYSLAKGNFRNTVIYGVILGSSYYVSTKLGYYVNEIMIRICSRKS